MSRYTWHVVASAIVMLFVALASDAQLSVGASTVSGSLKVTGSSTLLPLVTEIARRFEGLHPATKIDVQGGGSGKGVADLRGSKSDIAMVSRPLLDAERDLYAFPLVRDGVAAVVHRSNPVKGLNTQQLRDLITGRATNWKALGGGNAPIVFGWRGKGQGSSETVLEHLHVEHDHVGAHTLVISNAEALKLVSENPNAVTLVSVGEAERRAQAGLGIKLLAYNGVPASSRSIRRGSYLLSRPLTLVGQRIPSGLQKTFIDYALSSHVRDLHLKYDFVPYEE